MLVFGSLRLDDDLSYSINVPHRFNAVDDQIHRHLLQLHAISDDLGKVGRKFRADQYAGSPRLVAQQSDGLLIDLVDINNLSIGGASWNSARILPMMLRGTLRISCKSGDNRAQFIGIGIVALELSQARVGVGSSATDRLTDFMRQGCRQLSHGCHPVDAGQIALRLA